MYEGGCLCGAVRFRAMGAPKGVFWCHCQSCRRHSGAPVSVFVGFERGAYSVTKGEITKFKSSSGTTRGFCRTCLGKPARYRSASPEGRPGRWNLSARRQ
jgi:hypothetical protein